MKKSQGDKVATICALFTLLVLSRKTNKMVKKYTKKVNIKGII